MHAPLIQTPKHNTHTHPCPPAPGHTHPAPRHCPKLKNDTAEPMGAGLAQGQSWDPIIAVKIS